MRREAVNDPGTQTQGTCQGLIKRFAPASQLLETGQVDPVRQCESFGLSGGSRSRL